MKALFAAAAALALAACDAERPIGNQVGDDNTVIYDCEPGEVCK